MTDEQEKQHAPEIEALIKIAFENGINAAMKAAGEKNNPHFLDDFHDALIVAIRNHPELINKLK